MVEKKLFESKDTHVPLPDFGPLVGKAKLGNQDAFEEIDHHLRPRLYKYFSTIIKDQADDLVQSAMEKVAMGLSQFTPREEKHFSEQFMGWCFTIAKNTLNDEFAKQARSMSAPISQMRRGDDFLDRSDQDIMDYYSQRSKRSSPDDDGTEKDSQQEVLLLLRKKLAEILPKRQIKIVDLVLEGKSNSEIASELGRSERGIKVDLSHARKKIEEELIFPVGYKRVAKLWMSRHSTNINPRLGAVKFLRLWYISDEALKNYQAQKAPNQELLNTGYVLLSEVASEDEYNYLLKYRPYLLTSKRRRLYILPESLNEFRQTRNKKPSKIVPPEPQYSHISNFSTTARNHNILRDALLSGELKGIKDRGLWFTTQEAVDRFWQDKLQSPNNATKVSPAFKEQEI